MTEQSRDTAETGGDHRGIPGLIRAARRAYGNAVRDAFTEAGFDDVPRNGAYVLARVYDDQSPFSTLVRELAISKQAVSQLIDTMVMRGYLERTPDTEDRRRMLLHLTPRGEAAATISWQAAASVDDKLVQRLGADGVAALRVGLIALNEISVEDEAAHDEAAHDEAAHDEARGRDRQPSHGHDHDRGHDHGHGH